METIEKVTPVVKGETYPRTFSVDENIVWMSQVTELKDGACYFRYGLNLENVDGDDVMKHAAKDINIVIMRPRCFKKLTSNQVAELPLILDPADYPASERVGMSEDERLVKSLEKIGLSHEDATFYVENKDQLKAALTETEEIGEDAGENEDEPEEDVE